MTFKQSGTDLFNLCEMKFNRKSKLVNWSTLQVLTHSNSSCMRLLRYIHYILQIQYYSEGKRDIELSYMLVKICGSHREYTPSVTSNHNNK